MVRECVKPAELDALEIFEHLKLKPLNNCMSVLPAFWSRPVLLDWLELSIYYLSSELTTQSATLHSLLPVTEVLSLAGSSCVTT